MHSFVFSALILVGLDPGVYFLRETNIRVFITDNARGRCWINRANCTKEIFQGLFDEVFRDRRGRVGGPAINFIVLNKRAALKYFYFIHLDLTTSAWLLLSIWGSYYQELGRHSGTRLR